MALTLICGPCREWGEWIPIVENPHFPQDDYIFFTPEDPNGIDEPNCRWWYLKPGQTQKFYLNITWFTLYGRHGWIIFPTTTHGLEKGNYPLHCDIVNTAGQHLYNNWIIIV